MMERFLKILMLALCTTGFATECMAEETPESKVGSKLGSKVESKANAKKIDPKIETKANSTDGSKTESTTNSKVDSKDGSKIDPKDKLQADTTVDPKTDLKTDSVDEAKDHPKDEDEAKDENKDGNENEAKDETDTTDSKDDSNTKAEAEPEFFYPYLGLDLKWQRTEGRGDWNRLVPRTYPGAAIFTGERFNQYWGLELGYSETTKKTKVHTFANGENFYNNGNTANAITRVSTKFRSLYLDLNAYYPLNPCFELIGSIGAGLVRPKVKVHILNLGLVNGHTGFSASDAADLSTTKGKTRGFFRLGAGAQAFISDSVGIRALFRWETTSTARVKGRYDFQQNTIQSAGVRRMFKDTFSITLGAFCKFE